MPLMTMQTTDVAIATMAVGSRQLDMSRKLCPSGMLPLPDSWATAVLHLEFTCLTARPCSRLQFCRQFSNNACSFHLAYFLTLKHSAHCPHYLVPLQLSLGSFITSQTVANSHTIAVHTERTRPLYHHHRQRIDDVSHLELPARITVRG